MAFEFKNSYKSEKDFQTDYIKWLKENGFWVYKLPDIWFTLKPFDIIAVRDWEASAIELKYWRVDTYDKIYKMLRPNQIGWLLHFKEHWGNSLIVWWDTKENDTYLHEFIYFDDYEWAL